MPRSDISVASVASDAPGAAYFLASCAEETAERISRTAAKSAAAAATIVSTALMALFVMLIALQFNDDIANAGAMMS